MDEQLGGKREQSGFAQDPVALARSLQPLVREHADQSESQRHLAREVAEAFAQSGLYRIAAPHDSFGSEHPPLTQIETIEQIAKADGSAAWNLMIGIESFGLIAPGFGPLLYLIEESSAVIASSTAAVGRAEKVDGGYVVSGQWPFVSGCHNANLFGATVAIWEDGETQTHVGNRYAMISAPDFEILDTWHTGGLCGSGSHDVRVDGVFIDESRLVQPIGGAEHDSALLRFPLGARLAYNKIGVSWGLAQTAIDAFVDLAQGKTPRFSRIGLRDRARAQLAVAEATVRFKSGRALVVDLLEQMWSQVLGRGHVTSAERGMFQLACSDSARGCREAVDVLCEAAGTSANMRGHPLERIARDVRVVGQHVTVAPHHIEDAGRILLGLPAQEIMLAGMQSS